ncbi:MAG: hypothetical protein KDN19_11860 [Verrucomicrobiae bacterium]|nr:hypothetical protein [Verrucomicrobiae bacterium]
MTERPPLASRGRIVAVREVDRLYEIEMPNGYRALAVLPQEIDRPPTADPVNLSAEVHFSPYDMSRCRIARWNVS